MMPGTDKGRVTSRKARHGGLPRSPAASSRMIQLLERGKQRQDHEGQIGIDDAKIHGKGTCA